jgi:ERF superfamily
LAHSSGEWLSSDWPVCPIAETTAPHRMGTALTYARRYSLFTLVGIAGEDDLDAPDVAISSLPADQPIGSVQGRNGQISGSTSPTARRERARARLPVTILAPDQSALARDRLLGELQSLQTGDAAATWAQQNLPTKSTLTDADAKIVESYFQARLATLIDEQPEGPVEPADEGQKAAQPTLEAPEPPTVPASGPVVVRGRVAAKTVRLRDKDHRKFVSGQPCLVCGRTPTDAHHLGFAQPRAMGRKVSDEFTVPVCRLHHRELHRHGNEAAWWQSMRLDPLPIARGFWQRERLTESVDKNGAANPQFITATRALDTEIGIAKNDNSQDLDNL